MRRFGLFGAFLVVITAVTGCQTTQPVREVTQSGFLGDYSLLQPGAEGEAALVYVNRAQILAPTIRCSSIR